MPDAPACLVYTQTAGCRHGSIPKGVAAIRKMGRENGFAVVATEHPSRIRPDFLENFTAVVRVEDAAHPSTAGLPVAWKRWDEWYDFRVNPRGKVRVLATLDEKTYRGGKMGDDHPIIWCHENAGGRSWYTGCGHTRRGFADPVYLGHLLGGLEYALRLEGGS